jgi:acyl carrier protein
MTHEEFLSEFQEILELPPGSLQGSEILSDLEKWDSLAMMSFIALASEKCGVTLSPRQLLGCQTVDDLLAIAHVSKP